MRSVVRCGNSAKAGKGHCRAHKEAHVYLMAAGGGALALAQGSAELAGCVHAPARAATARCTPAER